MSDTNNKPRAADADTASVAVPEGFKLVPNLGDLVERLALKHIAPNAKAMFPDKDYRETEQFRRVLAYTEDMLAALAQDTEPAVPTGDHFASMTRMFHAACADLGAINEALGLDPDDGGAEPILDAIAELKRERDQWVDAQFAAAGTAPLPRASDAQKEPVATVLRKGNQVGSIVWTELGANADLPDGTKLYSSLQAECSSSADPLDIFPDTGNDEADRVIRRLSSADPDFNDCADAAALIRKLVVEHRGPDGFATWKDAAIDERLKRVNAAPQEADSADAQRTDAEGLTDDPREAFIRDVAEQTSEMPDYWSSCAQCERNIERAQDILEAMQGNGSAA